MELRGQCSGDHLFQPFVEHLKENESSINKSDLAPQCPERSGKGKTLTPGCKRGCFNPRLTNGRRFEPSLTSGREVK